jgi:putative Holliday junction resolvase
MILGFDYGRKRIGVAVGQTLTQSATPLTQISVHDGEPDWQAIEKLIQEWKPYLLLVGLPFNMDGSAGPMVKVVKKFIAQLQERTHLPVESINEALSSREAKSRIADLQGNKRYSKEMLNSVAAQVIVETYLLG